MKHEKLTEQIIKAFYTVYNALGYGFLEKVYENAMYLELVEMGLKVTRQNKIFVHYKQQVIGDYCTDMTIEDVIICELKACERLSEKMKSSLLII